VLVCGNRTCLRDEWYYTIYAWLVRCPKGTTIIHGARVTRDARGNAVGGADWIAGEVARELGFAVEEYPADWKAEPKRAGPIRNALMATKNITRGLAFGNLLKTASKPVATIDDWRDLKRTGTGDMVQRLLDIGVACTVVPRPGVMP
jgi:hypothetical protein